MAIELASITDINVHLPIDKAQIGDGQDTELQVDAFRLIRARLASTFTLATINTWINYEETPEIIRKVASMLIAAKFYATLVAEDEADGSTFAQDLFNQAMALLQEIRDGALEVIDPDGNVIDNSSFSSLDFWPNDSTEPSSFAIGQVWS